MTFANTLARVAVVAASLAGAQTAAADTLILGYLNRPGFSSMVDGKASGAFLTPAAAAVAKSGLQVEWQPLPQKRLIDQVRQDMPNYCAVGIYKTPERAGFAKFSEPFYRDRQFVVAASTAREANIRSHSSFAALAEDPKLKLGAIDGYSYGVEVDRRIKAMGANVDLAVVTPDKILAKLGAGRIDYALAAPEEFDVSLKQSGVKPEDLVQIAMPDMPDGSMRYFMCARSVDDATLAKLSAGVESMHFELK